MAPDVGSIDPGMAIVGAEDPILYFVKWIAIVVMMAAVLIIICDDKERTR